MINLNLANKKILMKKKKKFVNSFILFFFDKKKMYTIDCLITNKSFYTGLFILSYVIISYSPSLLDKHEDSILKHISGFY